MCPKWNTVIDGAGEANFTIDKGTHGPHRLIYTGIGGGEVVIKFTDVYYQDDPTPRVYFRLGKDGIRDGLGSRDNDQTSHEMCRVAFPNEVDQWIVDNGKHVDEYHYHRPRI